MKQQARNKAQQTSFEASQQGVLQRAAINASPVNAVPPIVHDVLSSPGQPLDTGTREFMEPRFGQDFSQVRVHTDEQSAQSAQAVNALAYTVGKDVVFGTGQYAPETAEGRGLLAHELTHVVQQGAQSSSHISSAEKAIMSNPADASERVATTAGQAVANESHISAQVMMPGPLSQLLFIQRKEAPSSSEAQQPSSTKQSSALATLDEFGFNHTELTKKHIEMLDALASSILSKLVSSPNATIMIVGHTDAPGKEENNLVLGLRRAESVWRYLISKKVPSGAMRVVSMGATQLLIKSPDKQSRNRRVEIIVEAESGAAQGEKSSIDRNEITPREVKKTVSPPPGGKIPANQVEQITKLPSPSNLEHKGSPQPEAENQQSDEEKFHVGADVSGGTTPVNLQLGKIPQGQERNQVSSDYQLVLVLHNIHKPVYSNDKFTLDLAHDPGVGLGLSLHGPDPDGNRANFTTQISFDVLDMIFKRNRQDFYELHLAAAGAVDLTSKLGGAGNVSLQAQPGIGNELHLSSNSSLFLNLTGTISYDTQKKEFAYYFGPVTLGFLYHINP